MPVPGFNHIDTLNTYIQNYNESTQTRYGLGPGQAGSETLARSDPIIFLTSPARSDPSFSGQPDFY